MVPDRVIVQISRDIRVTVYEILSANWRLLVFFDELSNSIWFSFRQNVFVYSFSEAEREIEPQ